MKNLANCKPSEFLVQTNKLRKSAEKWLTATDILNIRKVSPEFLEGMTREQRKEAIQKKIKENASKALDAMLEEHAAETLELLALACFVEPENVDDHSIGEYIESLNELINDKAVLGFFTSLVRLGQTNI